MAALVTVYAFRRWDRSEGRMVLAPKMATKAAIKSLLRTELMPDTGQQVTADRIDAEGFYYPPSSHTDER